MRNRVVIDILEKLIGEIRETDASTVYYGDVCSLDSVDDDYIAYVEGVIKELREEERIKKLVESEQRELDKLAVERLNIEW